MSEVRAGSSEVRATATDKLRRLLDERGVEWSPSAWDRSTETYWKTADGNGCLAVQGETKLRLSFADYLTPEQAIDATLGRGTCHAVFEVDAMSEDERVGEFVCSECGETFGDGRDQRPNYCPNCGRAVVE